MKEYKGMFQKTIERAIANGAQYIEINWLDMSTHEAESGGAAKCTELLLAAGYRPDGSVVIQKLRKRYEDGLRGEDNRFIRVPQEVWQKGGDATC